MTTCFIGMSPSFEFALYTLFFLIGEEDNFVHFDKYRVNIKCHNYNYKGKKKIGTCYPILLWFYYFKQYII